MDSLEMAGAAFLDPVDMCFTFPVAGSLLLLQLERGRGKCELVFAVHAKTDSDLRPGTWGRECSTLALEICHWLVSDLILEPVSLLY